MPRTPRKLDISSMVSQFLTRHPHRTSVRFVVPIAWPILLVDHMLRVRVGEELNVVERFVLEAISRFGPIAKHEIGELMGLDGVAVDHVVHRLGAFPGVIENTQDLIASGIDFEEGPEFRVWGREIGQVARFFVNGPVGALAPISLNDLPKSIWLKLDFCEEGTVIRDGSGNPHPRIFWVADAGSDANEHLSGLVHGVDEKERAYYGVPKGAFALGAVPGRTIERRWIFSFGTYSAESIFSVAIPMGPTVTLFHLHSDDRAVLEQFLRRGNEGGGGLFREFHHTTVDFGVPEAWKEHATFLRTGSTLAIQLKTPHAFPFWLPSGNASEADSVVPFPRDLFEMLESPFYWDPIHYTVNSICPSDAETAEVFVIRHAMKVLDENAATPLSQVEFSSWWIRMQHDLRSQWPSDPLRLDVPVEKVLAIARKSPSSDIVDLAASLL